MVGVKSVKLDGESIYVFNSAIYLFESASSCSLELGLIVSEVAFKKYKDMESLIVEIELDDGRILSSFMYLRTLPGRLPQINLFCELDETENYEGFHSVSENDSVFPNIEEGITLEDIRKVEMPNEKATLKLTLPIDQVEWLKNQKASDLNSIFKDLIYVYMNKQAREEH
ncbi:hypothetical protein SAMN05192533_11246 [Mesobacillus persicus]|uniref:Uncharacterized protein n=1 Tax=Mesobacillus persicus TaxID=930146 RepID=A0A1H8G1X1_9BACI|nr:hypothetical protein [Mesobacillus persicus]SEN37755.1 hypothetical protein SAMN05192533_11246 [Mesobacillus persicus]